MEYHILRFICLVITLFTLQFYVNLGVHSKTHRLLPVILTVICLFSFYDFVSVVSDNDDTILLLEQLLLVQVIYLLLHYILDFMNVKMPFILEILCFISLILGNIFTILAYLYSTPIYKFLYLAFVYGYTLIVFIATSILSFSKRIKSKRERYVVGMLFFALYIPLLCIPFRRYHKFGVPILSIGIICCCLIILYLLRNNYLIDLSQELQSNLYDTSQVATILYDSEMQYLNSNHIARSTFTSRFLQFAKNFPYDKEDSTLFYGGCYYRCNLQPVAFQNGLSGYILTALDITDEKKNIQNLSEEKQTVEKQSQEKSSFMSITSHKMRTPLNVIIGMSDYLLNQADITDDIKATIHNIKESGKNLLCYVEEILLQSGVQAQELESLEEPYLITPSLPNIEERILPNFLYPDARVLMAEDMKVNQSVFQKLVSPWNFQVDFVEDGQQAIEAVKNQNYQLIFLDKMMPVMNGIEAADAICKMTDTPLVVVTADSTDHLNTLYKDYGFSAYLSKPLDLAELKHIIETLMPVEYQEFDDEDDDIFIPVDNDLGVLDLYCNEVTEISSQLRDYLTSDITMFRTKVHGIKSSSKQLGFTSLGEKAEIMEMAAKLENMTFIQDHIDEFLEYCNQQIQQIQSGR